MKQQNKTTNLVSVLIFSIVVSSEVVAQQYKKRPAKKTDHDDHDSEQKRSAP